jgi:hypothetical protein
MRFSIGLILVDDKTARLEQIYLVVFLAGARAIFFRAPLQVPDVPL